MSKKIRKNESEHQVNNAHFVNQGKAVDLSIPKEKNIETTSNALSRLKVSDTNVSYVSSESTKQFGNQKNSNSFNSVSQAKEKTDFLEVETRDSIPNNHVINAVSQLKFTVKEKASGSNVTAINVGGRPSIKASIDALDVILKAKYPGEYEVDGSLKEGSIRAHIIGWNIKQREYISRLGLPKTKDELMTRFGKGSFEDVIRQIKYELTDIFYDATNYTINTTEGEEADRIPLRMAGQSFSQRGDLASLKEIYIRSFNVGKYGDGADKVEAYNTAFSRAYGVRPEVYAEWALRLPEEASDEEFSDEEELDIAGPADDGNYKIGDGLKLNNEEWIEETFDLFEDTPTSLFEFAEMLMVSFPEDARMKIIFKKYLGKINQVLTVTEEMAELFEDETEKIVTFYETH